MSSSKGGSIHLVNVAGTVWILAKARMTDKTYFYALAVNMDSRESEDDLIRA